ncbi:MAG: hypothetical protein HZA92_19800 [Verrucomicrobia bacterium]|nr:hypothetical protein [Verrucomicrobiota bacterium]
MNIRRPLVELSALLVLIELLSCALPASGATTNVFMNNFTFTPAVVNVRVGDTVTWMNQAGSHTVTGTGSDPFCGSGTVPVSCSVTFNTVGSFPYICIPHVGFNMTGLVTVAAANVPPSISFTSPTNGTKVLAGTGRNLDVTTFDTDGTVVRVDYFASETAGTLGDPIGFTTAAPFQLPTGNIPAGTFFLTAVATDNQGATNSSAVVRLFSLTNATLTPALPLMSSAVFTISNSFNGQEYFVDALTNFTGTLSTRWFPIATNTAPSNNFIFTDSVLLAPIPRLYRVRQTL